MELAQIAVTKALGLIAGDDPEGEQTEEREEIDKDRFTLDTVKWGSNGERTGDEKIRQVLIDSNLDIVFVVRQDICRWVVIKNTAVCEESRANLSRGY